MKIKINLPDPEPVSWQDIKLGSVFRSNIGGVFVRLDDGAIQVLTSTGEGLLYPIIYSSEEMDKSDEFAECTPIPQSSVELTFND